MGFVPSLSVQRKAWVRWKQLHGKAKQHRQAVRQGQAHCLAPVLAAWRARAHKLHRAKAFAKLLALKAQHRSDIPQTLLDAQVFAYHCDLSGTLCRATLQTLHWEAEDTRHHPKILPAA